MLEEIEVLGEVTDKGFRFCDREHVVNVLRGFKRGPVVCRFKVYRDTRSNQANRYYRGVVLKAMAEDSGNSPDDIHDAMCERFLRNEQKHVEFFNRLTGEVLEVETVDTRRSSKLNREEFYTFVEQVRQFAAEWLHIETPDPDPSYWRRKERKAA